MVAPAARWHQSGEDQPAAKRAEPSPAAGVAYGPHSTPLTFWHTSVISFLNSSLFKGSWHYSKQNPTVNWLSVSDNSIRTAQRYMHGCDSPCLTACLTKCSFQKSASFFICLMVKVEAFKLVVSVHEEKTSKALMWARHREVRCPNWPHCVTVAELWVESPLQKWAFGMSDWQKYFFQTRKSVGLYLVTTRNSWEKYQPP